MSELNLLWKNHKMVILNGVNLLFEDDNLTDMTIICNDGAIEVHKVVMTFCSPFFRRICEANPQKTIKISATNITLVEMIAVLEFMYKGATKIPEEIYKKVLEIGDYLEMPGFREAVTMGVGNDSAICIDNSPSFSIIELPSDENEIQNILQNQNNIQSEIKNKEEDQTKIKQQDEINTKQQSQTKTKENDECNTKEQDEIKTKEGQKEVKQQDTKVQDLIKTKEKDPIGTKEQDEIKTKEQDQKKIKVQEKINTKEQRQTKTKEKDEYTTKEQDPINIKEKDPIDIKEKDPIDIKEKDPIGILKQDEIKIEEEEEGEYQMQLEQEEIHIKDEHESQIIEEDEMEEQQNIVIPTVSCFRCNEFFEDPEDLTLHYTIKHEKEEEEKSYDCSICNAKFTGISQLQHHYLAHIDKKLYTCLKCLTIHIGLKRFTNHIQTVCRSKWLSLLCNVEGDVLQQHANDNAMASSRVGNATQAQFENEQQKTGTPKSMENLNITMCSIATNVQDENKPHECEICYTKFATASELESHHLIHIDKNRYTCVRCKKQFSGRDEFKNHIQTVCRSQLLKLLYGFQEPHENSDNNALVIDESPEVPMTVPTNIITIKEEVEEEVKIKIEEEETHLFCRICNQTFKDENELSLHSTIAHAYNKNKVYKCSTCSKTYKYAVHLNFHHCAAPVRNNRYTCLKCKMQFFRLSDFENHTRTTCFSEIINDEEQQDKDKASIIVPQKKNVVQEKYDLVYAILNQTYENEQNLSHRCDICSVKFETAEELESHRSSHFGETFYTCPKCKKTIIGRDIYKYHIERVCPNEFAKSILKRDEDISNGAYSQLSNKGNVSGNQGQRKEPPVKRKKSPQANTAKRACYNTRNLPSGSGNKKQGKEKTSKPLENQQTNAKPSSSNTTKLPSAGANNKKECKGNKLTQKPPPFYKTTNLPSASGNKEKECKENKDNKPKENKKPYSFSTTTKLPTGSGKNKAESKENKFQRPKENPKSLSQYNTRSLTSGSGQRECKENKLIPKPEETKQNFSFYRAANLPSATGKNKTESKEYKLSRPKENEKPFSSSNITSLPSSSDINKESNEKNLIPKPGENKQPFSLFYNTTSIPSRSDTNENECKENELIPNLEGHHEPFSFHNITNFPSGSNEEQCKESDLPKPEKNIHKTKIERLTYSKIDLPYGDFDYMVASQNTPMEPVIEIYSSGDEAYDEIKIEEMKLEDEPYDS